MKTYVIDDQALFTAALFHLEKEQYGMPITWVPAGTPGIRDVDHPCDVFEPGVPNGTGSCQSDGHYLCQECVHLCAENKDNV